MQFRSKRASTRIGKRVVTGAAVMAVVLGSTVAAAGTASAAKTRVNCDNKSFYLVTYSNGNSRCFRQNSLYVSSAKRVDLMPGAMGAGDDGNFNVQINYGRDACTSLQHSVRGLKNNLTFAPGRNFSATIYSGTWTPSSVSEGPGHFEAPCGLSV
ncbi:hypothetical protein OG474_38675 [Kribbella sp. NBC_01505]|uniref:hypothetical protein n=1 Tax=Kribbella sp. NBC_01505 TaxID=2903580 RepID=UPI00386AE641